jgi:hypothetical protein
MMRIFLIAAFAAIALTGCKDNSDALKVSSGGMNAESVYLTHDNLDNPVVVWTERNDKTLNLSFAVSRDDGNTFSKKHTIALDEDVATHAEGMPKVAFKRDGTILVAYEKKAPTKENKYAGAIYYITSSDNGESWSRERYMHSDTVAGLSRSYFDIETLPDGQVAAAWLDIKLDNTTGGRSVRFARTDDTNAFTNEMLIDSSACQCCRVDMYSDVNSNVYVAYRGLRMANMGKQVRDMMVCTSGDQGKTFSSPLNISIDNWNIDGCPHTGPSLCSNKTGLFTLWYTQGTGDGIYFTHKPAVGDQFVPRELVSRGGRHPQVTANNDRIAMVWEENVGKERPLTNVHFRIIREGMDIQKDILTPENVNAFLPVVAPTKEGFLAAYLMEEGDNVAVFLRKL